MPAGGVAPFVMGPAGALAAGREERRCGVGRAETSLRTTGSSGWGHLRPAIAIVDLPGVTTSLRVKILVTNLNIVASRSCDRELTLHIVNVCAIERGKKV